MVGSINVGKKRIWMTAYNPSDELAKMYCVMLMDMVMEKISDITQEEAHAWLREHYPDTSQYLDMVEAGKTPVRDYESDEHPVRPGSEELDKQIIAFLRKRKARLFV